MDATTASVIAASAAAVSASVLTIVSFFNIIALRTQVKVADYNNCLQLVRHLSDTQRAVFTSKCDSQRYDFEFRELLNLIEAVALLINRSQITKSTKEYSTDFICEALAWIESDTSMHDTLKNAVTADNTFKELNIFRKLHRTRIDTLAHDYRDRPGSNKSEETSSE
jgi:hypothetical protein